jgi:hypothetical protein
MINILLELGKWSNVSQEIAIFIITLMEDQWVPKLRLDVAKEAARLNGKWPPRYNITKFRMMKIHVFIILKFKQKIFLHYVKQSNKTL